MTKFLKIEDWLWCDYLKVGSTNDELKKYLLASGNFEKIVITAKEQTSGKGRLDHKWISMPGNLFMSLALKWNIQDIGLLSLISSLSLLQSIKSYSPSKEILLKWPNDVFLEHKKVSGILIESISPSFAIVGVGVNIEQAPILNNQSDYLPTSLKEQGIIVDRLDFMRQYLRFFNEISQIYYHQGNSAIINAWQQNALGIGRDIKVKTSKKELCGKFLGLDKQGMLLLQTNNNIETISAGDVSF